MAAKAKAKQKGMTLIEVMIASVILFIAIGTISGAHVILNHYQRLAQADYAVILNQHSLVDYFQYQLEQGVLSGEYRSGNYLYKWNAEVDAESGALSTWDPESGGQGGYNYFGKLTLYRIEFFSESSSQKKHVVKLLVTAPGETLSGF